MTDYYFLACEFMAKTELFDMSLTSCRSPHDPTEAFIRQPELVKLSRKFAHLLQQKYRHDWHKIKYEINLHHFYSAQMWVDEWHRLLEERNKTKGIQGYTVIDMNFNFNINMEDNFNE